MAPLRTPPGWPHFALLLSVLLLSACRPSAQSPPASEAQPRPATLKSTFVTAWGARGGEDGQFNGPTAVVVDAAGNLHVADTKNHRVQKFSQAGTFLKAWGSYGFTAGRFNAPSGIAVDRTGDVFVADTWNHRIQKFDAGGKYLLEWGALGRGDGRVNAPTGIAGARAGGVYVISAGLQPAPSRNLADILRVQRVQVFTGAGTLLQAWGRAGSGAGQFDRAGALAMDRAGNVYVADTENHRVQKFGPSGTPLRQWGALPGEGLKRPAALTADAAGHVYIADQGNFRVVRVDQRGTVLAVWRFSQTAVFEDVAVGPAGAVYVALTESGVPLVRTLSAPGATEGELRGFASVKGGAVGGARGDFYRPGGSPRDGPGNFSGAEPLLNRVQVFRVKLSPD